MQKIEKRKTRVKMRESQMQARSQAVASEVQMLLFKKEKRKSYKMNIYSCSFPVDPQTHAMLTSSILKIHLPSAIPSNMGFNVYFGIHLEASPIPFTHW